MDPNCNNGLEEESIICVHAGTYEIDDTVRVKAAFQITLYALGDGVTFDGFGQSQIFNSARTPIKFRGFTFANGYGGSGCGVYGEARMDFESCHFVDNEATADAAAVMVSREGHFIDCTFVGNSAKWGGAVRISDIGHASFDRCKFIRNSASSKGGAIVTQIESPHRHYVKIQNSLFCMNESPLGKHIYDFRDAGHECTNCSFNTRECCSNNGMVASISSIGSKTIAKGETKSSSLSESNIHVAAIAEDNTGTSDKSLDQEEDDTRVQGCKCDDGWAGDVCEVKSTPGHRGGEL